MQLKIDSIKLHYFSGHDLKEWTSFRDFFKYLIHDNQTMSDVLKLHQLRTHLKGEAFDMIKGYDLFERNYQAAWTNLNRRYNRKEELVQAYIRSFIETPALIKANFTRSRTIIDKTNQMLHSV